MQPCSVTVPRAAGGSGSHRGDTGAVVPSLELLLAVASRALWGKQSSDPGMSQPCAEPGMLSCPRAGIHSLSPSERKGRALFLLQDEQLVALALG